MSPLSPEARALLESARGAGGPTPSQRTAMKRAVLAAALVPASAAALGGASTPAAAGGVGVVKLIAVVLVSAAVGAGATFTALRPAAAPVQTTPQALVPRQKVEAPPQLTAPVEPVVEVPPPPPEKNRVPRAVPPPAPVVENKTDPTAAPVVATPELPSLPLPPPPRVTPSPAPADDAALAKEVAALSGAMTDVDANRHQDALDKLQHYRASFPAGALSTEAGVLEVLALCGLGRVDDAKAITFPAASANNPALRRIENSCVSSQRNQKAPATQKVQGDDK